MQGISYIEPGLVTSERRMHCIQVWCVLVHCTHMTGSVLCLNGGTCSGYGYCYCPNGYTGRICETGEFRLAAAVVAVFTCSSSLPPPPFLISLLLVVEVCGPYNNTICYNNGTCQSGSCVCPSPYTGYDCSTEMCEYTVNMRCVDWSCEQHCSYVYCMFCECRRQ